MSDDPRDTQFAGFAKLLLKGMEEVSCITYASPEDFKKAHELYIAQRAYDFLLHSAYHSSLLATIEECKRRIALVPDMTAWTKEHEA